MSILFELRYPTRWYTKLLTIVLALVFFTVLATAVISCVLVYWIVKPQRTSSEISMASFPGRPDEVDFTVPGLGSRKGWFFPGLRGGPHDFAVSRLSIQPRRTINAGFRAPGSPVQRICL